MYKKIEKNTYLITEYPSFSYSRIQTRTCCCVHFFYNFWYIYIC